MTTDRLGAAAAIEFGPRDRMTAAAEPTRRGGGAAPVVHRAEALDLTRHPQLRRGVPFADD